MARDATCVLDEILGNDMELPIAEHVVDTSGFTEAAFVAARVWKLFVRPVRLRANSARLRGLLGRSGATTAPGEYKVAVRATDGSGQLQAKRQTSINPDGATGCHEVVARAEA